MSDWSIAREFLPAGYRLEVLERTTSTNDVVRNCGAAGEAAGIVIAAEQQEAGRGRRGAAWVSPPGEGLAFSVLVRPTENKALWPRLSMAAGLAVAEALERFGVTAEVKWPNDVWIKGRKIAGILVEAGEDFVVAGIGVNVGVAEFPGELAATATSLLIESGEAPALGAVLAAVVARFDVWQGAIGGRFDELLRRLRERCALTGHEISLITADGPRTGIARGFGDGGELLLESGGELQRIIQADEVRVVG
ncbi:MAG: Biotin--acetyl-CoA-carboxylase ligase [Akkermansiaceae bacterium]|nr:Biotin--acetyl-CoA-carboxylase ligase [Akkermansiaceae bacterium]